MNPGCTRAPVLLVKESDARRVEFLFMIEQALAEQVNGVGGVCESVEEVRCGHQRIGKQLVPDCVARCRYGVLRIRCRVHCIGACVVASGRAFVGCDEELVAFCVEYRGDCFDG